MASLSKCSEAWIPSITLKKKQIGTAPYSVVIAHITRDVRIL